MRWLVSLPAGLLVVAWCVIAVAVALVSRWVIFRVVPAEERDSVPGIVAPLMPALGATFAVLMALTVSSEATYLRSAQDIVSTESAQAARLAWAATNPGVETAPIQEALADYLRATRADEWDGDSDDRETADEIAAIERVVRTEAANADLGTPISTELLAALDGVTSARRARLAAESHDLPVLYVVTLVACGLALVVNAGALTFRSSLRASVLVMGLAVVVALSLSLLFALTAPWQGAIRVSAEPVDTIITDIDEGYFQR